MLCMCNIRLMRINISTCLEINFNIKIHYNLLLYSFHVKTNKVYILWAKN